MKGRQVRLLSTGKTHVPMTFKTIFSPFPLIRQCESVSCLILWYLDSGLDKRSIWHRNVILRKSWVNRGRLGWLKPFENLSALNCVVISTVGVQIREPSPWARPVAEAFPAEVIGGWWCLGRTLRNNTLYSEQWKITSRPVQLWEASWQRAMSVSTQR